MVGAAAFLGMVNGMGRDRGAALILEQAILPATAARADRTGAFAVYNVLQDSATRSAPSPRACPPLLRPVGSAELTALRLGRCSYAALLAITGLLYAGLSRRPRPPPGLAGDLSPATRRLLVRICGLFAIDSLAGGFLTTALLAVFFVQRFGARLRPSARSSSPHASPTPCPTSAPPGSRTASGCQHDGVHPHPLEPAARDRRLRAELPDRRGALPAARGPGRDGRADATVVRDGRRPARGATCASGVTHLVRLGAWAVAPAFAGMLMRGLAGHRRSFWAGMKIAYDLALYVAFRGIRPVEEEAPSSPEQGLCGCAVCRLYALPRLAS